MPGFAKAQILGNVGKKPEIRLTQGGTPMVNFSVAVNNHDTSRTTDWYRVIVFGKKAELCEKFVEKGDLILVDGRCQITSWTGKDGTTVRTLEIVATDVQFLGGYGGRSKDSKSEGDSYSSSYEEAEGGLKKYDEDDIPF